MSASDQAKRANNETITSPTISNPALQVIPPMLPTKTEFSLEEDNARKATVNESKS